MWLDLLLEQWPVWECKQQGKHEGDRKNSGSHLQQPSLLVSVFLSPIYHQLYLVQTVYVPCFFFYFVVALCVCAEHKLPVIVKALRRMVL